jgi:predicted nucleic acid-binding protein
MIIIDTDILIWILRRKTEYVLQYKTIVESFQGQIFITPIQYMEIMAGIRENEKIQTEIFLDSLGMVNITKETGKLAGYFINKYQKSYDIQNADALIAASVKNTSYKLWTLNRKHYPMLQKNEFLNIKIEEE